MYLGRADMLCPPVVSGFVPIAAVSNCTKILDKGSDNSGKPRRIALHLLVPFFAYHVGRSFGIIGAAMDTSNSITAAVFSAFLKCPTKAHLMAIGEPAPGAFFTDIEARISSMYKAAAKQRFPIKAEMAELLDFGQLWRGLGYEAITHHVDCDTAVYNFAPPPHRIGSPPTAGINVIRHLCPRPAFTLGQAGSFRQPARVFRCARAIADHRNTGRHRNTDLRRWLPPQNRENWGPRRPDAPDH